ncbi:MAG: sulfotransferase family protein [Nocardioides sp.]|nr:sulfotransferase family protein [Nocardioides sp.]
MIVSHERRVLFVHVQKTGGITVEKTLVERLPGAVKLARLPGRRHARLGAVLRVHPEVADYWTFGFVRNPWARMWSWYAMIQRRQGAAEGGNSRVATRIERNAFWSGVLDDIPDFETFVMQGPDRFARLGTPQVRYLRTPQKQADFIGRTERLDEDLAQVCERLGLEAPPSVPRRNVGTTSDHRRHYTPAMRDRVGELYARDVALFGYRFDDL